MGYKNTLGRTEESINLKMDNTNCPILTTEKKVDWKKKKKEHISGICRTITEDHIFMELKEYSNN